MATNAMVDEDMELTLLLSMAGFDHYKEAFDVAGISIKKLLAMTHEELNILATELNMPGDDLFQLQIQIYMQKSGPLSPITPITMRTPERIDGAQVAGHNESPVQPVYATPFQAHQRAQQARQLAAQTAKRKALISPILASTPETWTPTDGAQVDGHNSSSSAGHNSSPVPLGYTTPVRAHPVRAHPVRAHPVRAHQLAAQMAKRKTLGLVFRRSPISPILARTPESWTPPDGAQVAGHNSSSSGHNSSPVPLVYATPIRAHQLGPQMQQIQTSGLVLGTYDEVKLMSYEHSNAMCKSCMLDNKNSGSRVKIYRCRTVLSKKLAKFMGPEMSVCNYCLYWTKKKGA